MENTYDSNRNMTERKESAGIWHYIKTFCSFFSILSTLAFIGILTNYRSHFIPYLVAIWGLGVVAGVLVSPGKFFKFGFGIVGAIAKFAWFILPFPYDLIPLIFAIPFGILLVLAIMIIIPGVFTVYTYYNNIVFGATDKNKELITIGAGVGAALILFGTFLGITGIGKLVEAPKMEREFDTYAIYEAYMTDHDEPVEYLESSLAEPISVVESDDGYIRECYFEFEQYVDNLCSEHKVWITYDWYNDKWNITKIEEESTPVTFTTVSGTWYGKGTFPLNASYGNEYTCNLTFTPDGGYGTIDVTCGAVSYHLDVVDIEMGEMRTSLNGGYYEEEYGSLQDMKLILGETLSITSWGTEYRYSDIECVYSFDSNAISFHSFANWLALTPELEA